MARSSSEKRKLTSESASAVLSQLVKESGGRLSEEAAGDWQSVLRKQLELTPAQEEALRAVPEDDVRRVKLGLMEAASAHGDVELKVPNGHGGSAGELSVRSFGSDAEGEFGIIVVHCHFGPGLKNWKCYWGPHRPDERPIRDPT